MPRMTDLEFIAIINDAESRAQSYCDELASVNEGLTKAYFQKPYGDEVEGRSQAVSSDVLDVVESDMPSLARVFLGTSAPITFQPTTDNEKEIQEAEEKTKYCHHLIAEQPWSYRVGMGFMKDASIQKMGVVKYFIEDAKSTEEIVYKSLSEDEYQDVIADLKRVPSDKVEIIGADENEDLTRDIKFKVTRNKQEFKVVGVPTDRFVISEGACSEDEAELIGDISEKTRGQLLAEGYKRDVINRLPTYKSNKNKVRTTQNNKYDEAENIAEWASETVEISNLFVKIDYDGDGIAERRHIEKSGNVILKNEAFNHVPYAILSGIILAHSAIGRSRGELAQKTQRQKSVMLRHTYDNIIAVNNPRNVVHNDVNLDDMLNGAFNGIVRMTKGSQIAPANAVMPLMTPYVGDKSMQIIQYLDHSRAQSTGVNAASQGLDADAISNETATRFNGTREDSQAKIELVVRNFSETGFRKLYEGCAWWVSRYQDAAREVLILGKAMTVDPKKWRYEHFASSKVGAGSGSSSERTANLQGLLGIQQQLKSQGSMLVDDAKLYHTVSELTKGLGFKQVDEFYNDPKQPQQIIIAQNEALKMQLQQAQMMIEQMQNPLLQPEIIRAKAKAEADNKTAALNIAKLKEEQRQFDIETAQKDEQADQKTAVELTKIEATTNKNVDGSLI